MLAGRSAEIGNDAGEARHLVTHLPDLAQYGIFRATLDDAASCSVMEQKVQPRKQPRWIATEKRIILYAGMFALP